MSKFFFFIMMKESSDNPDKSCILLVRGFDSKAGDLHARLVDMHVIGTAQSHLCTERELHKNGLDYSNCLAAVINATNSMK